MLTSQRKNPNFLQPPPFLLLDLGCLRSVSSSFAPLHLISISSGHSLDLLSDLLKDTIMVFLEIELPWNVLIPPNQLDTKGLLLHKAIILHLLEDFATKKSSKEHGFYVAVTSLNKIGEGKIRELTGDVLFPVTFKCLVQKPCKGEILVGTVDKILKHGIFLKSGPYDSIFLSEKTMGDYHFVAGENPMFANEKQSKMDKDATVRFKVLGFRWNEVDRAFQVLATLAGDFLGPI